jgi:hypothetical protein
MVAQSQALARDQVSAAVQKVLRTTPVIDMHTHLFMPSLGTLGLWGIEQLLTYHYLEAELFRSPTVIPAVTPEQYWELSLRQKADIIWSTLFVRNTPISEATRGVIAVLDAFGLRADAPDLSEAREFFASRALHPHIRHVLKLAGVSEVVMTNDPLDPAEGNLWDRGAERDAQFHPVLRLDRILNRWDQHWGALLAQGYEVDRDAGGKSIAEVRRFLAVWIDRMKPVYLAVSLPDSFQYPEQSIRGRLLHEAALPACSESNLPLSLMIGVRYQANPRLKLAGDAAGRADLGALERLCADWPDNRFLVSLLSRENQHELCVYARKFSNLMPFGCWWFLNNPSIVEEITRERLEMLGTTFIPQHSDARVLEQVIYKWRNTRRTLAPILANAYQLLIEDGRAVTEADIQSDTTRLFRSNFEQIAGLRRESAAAGPDPIYLGT